MKIIILPFLLVYIITFNSSYLSAQNDSKDDMSNYFDEGNYSGKNILKINTLGLILGDLPVFYEKALADWFSLEAGVGVQLPYSKSEIYFPFDEIDMSAYINSGYSLWLQPKLFYHREAPELYYFSMLFRKGNYTAGSSKTKVSDYSLNQGFQIILKKNFTLDITIGSGIRIVKIIKNDNNFSTFGLYMPIGIKAGFAF